MRYWWLGAVAALKVVVLTLWVVAGTTGVSTKVAFAGGSAGVGEDTGPALEATEPGKETAGEASEEPETGLSALANVIEQAEMNREKSLIEAIKRKEAELDYAAEVLDAREKRLEAFERDLEERTRELSELHREVREMIAVLREADKKSVERLVKIYQSMNPEEAASRIEKLNEKTAVQILSSMREKNAAKILGLVRVDKSVRLTQSMKAEERVKDR